MIGEVHTFQVRNSHIRLVVEYVPHAEYWHVVRFGARRKVMVAYTSEESALRWARSYLGNRAYDVSVNVSGVPS